MRRWCLTLLGQTHCLSLELRRKESFSRLQVQRRYLVQDRIGWLRTDPASRTRALRAYDPREAAPAGARQDFESLFRMHTGFNGDEAVHSLHEGPRSGREPSFGNGSYRALGRISSSVLGILRFESKTRSAP